MLPLTPEEVEAYLVKAREKDSGSLFEGGFQEENLPLGHPRIELIEKSQHFPKVGACPHTDMLFRMAEIVGIKRETIIKNSHTYCGLRVHHVNNLGPLSGRQGRDFRPDSFCSRLYLVLAGIVKLEFFENLQVIIRQDGSCSVVLEAESIEEMDKVYQNAKMSLAKVHYSHAIAPAKSATEELLAIFGQEIDHEYVKWFQEMGCGKVAFVPTKGCDKAPKGRFRGRMALIGKK